MSGNESNTGYWGERTATVDWCEPNYVHSFYVAEWWNAMSSLPIVGMGLYGMYCFHKYKYEKRFFWSSFMMFVAGVGSTLFHGTLLYSGQAVDELGMIYGTMAYLYVIFEMEAKGKNKNYPWLIPLILFYGFVYTLAYFFFPAFFVVFVVLYIVLVTLIFYRSYSFYSAPSTPPDAKHLVAVGFFVYLGIFLFMWLPDLFLCHHTQWLNLHAWFHLGSTIAPYGCITFLCFERNRRKNRNPKINYLHLLGIIPVPYVHIELVNVKTD
jgi:dihydroceramidase